MADLSRRALLGTAGAGAVGTALSWKRLTGRDIPGRGRDELSIAINGTAQDAASNQGLIDAFQVKHPDIKVRIVPIQGTDWGDFFAKILTLVAAGTPPDVVMVATEGTQLFAERLAHPLDEFVTRDQEEMREFFDDVHPSLIEAFMYQGSLFQLPLSWNAANIYFSAKAMDVAGLDYPRMDWSWDDFRSHLMAMKRSATGTFRPFFWTNRMWGGVVPWLYSNDTSFLKPSRFEGGKWLWDAFYPQEKNRSGGYRWTEPNADDPKVLESFEFLQSLVADGLGSSPAQGGGNELVSRFGSGVIGMTPSGGYWVHGLAQAGMERDDYDVCYFPKGRTQQHQFGAAGYAIMKDSKRKDAAWEWLKFCVSREGMAIAQKNPDSNSARRSHNTELYKPHGPKHWEVFYGTLDAHPTTAPIPAPPQAAAVETALIKNVLGAVTGSQASVRTSLATLQRDLELALGKE